MVNPGQVRDFARATGRPPQTDALDAQVLAHFAQAVRPPVRPLPDSDTQELHSLTARRAQVVEMLAAEKSRLGRANLAVSPRIRALIQWLELEVNDLDQGLQQALHCSPYGRSRTTCCAPCPEWGRNSRCRCFRTCRNCGRWAEGR